MTEFGACTEFILELKEQMAWAGEGTLTGFTVSYRTDSVLLIVRTRTKNGHMVAFFTASALVQCWRNLYYEMHHRPGIAWKVDKFYKGG